MVEITLQPVQIGTLCADTEGRLAFTDGKLVAVLVRLSEELHAADGKAPRRAARRRSMPAADAG
jgi:hypothetical protein